MKKYAEAIISYKQSRREFLSGGAILGAGALAAVAIPGAVAEAAEQEIDDKSRKNKKEEGYRLTKHIVDYYKSASL